MAAAHEHGLRNDDVKARERICPSERSGATAERAAPPGFRLVNGSP